MSLSDAILDDDDVGLFRATVYANSHPNAFEGCGILGRKKQAWYTKILTRNWTEVKDNVSQA